MFIHSYIEGSKHGSDEKPASSRQQILTAYRDDAERILARWRQNQEGSTFTLISTAPFSGSSDHLQWVPDWEPGQDAILFARVPVCSWSPQYGSDKLITKMLLIYNADHEEETVYKTYTQDDEHLAEQHAEDFSGAIISPSEFVRVIDVRGLQGEVAALQQTVASLAQQLAEKSVSQ